MPKIFETPVRIELARDNAYSLLVANDCELIAEVWSASKEELEEIARRVNAYDGLVDLVRELALMEGEFHSADAGILVGRVSAAAVAKLKELGEEP